MLSFFLRATAILSYLPQEPLGTSFYEYFHEDDIAHLAECHRQGMHLTEGTMQNLINCCTYLQFMRFSQREGLLSMSSDYVD